jgi:methyl-accepting chemotaxis protein
MKRPNARAAGRSVASVRPGQMGPARPGAAAGSVQPLRGRPAPLPRRTLLLDLPSAWRLAVGFVLAALIAAAAAGVAGLQRAASLSRESAFYSQLLQTNTSLTTGNGFLQLMNTKMHDTLNDAAAPVPSRETLATDQLAVTGLAARYDAILAGYQRDDLLSTHPDEVAIVREANHSSQLTQQQSFASSAARTWQVYAAAQTQVLQDIAEGHFAEAQKLERAQAEPTNADAQSALRALIRFDARIASTIHDASAIEQQSQLITSLLAAVAAFIGVVVVGVVISNTLVYRLRQLRRVTQSVEEGRMDTRVAVVGRDEIAGVSQSVNGMLDTIVGLLEVTQRQRDALTSAAERLFADVRIAGAGDLSINAAVSGDPIGMLGNAFNLTVGRFWRFVMRTQNTVGQLELVARREYEHAEDFQGQLQRFAQRGALAQYPAHAAQAETPRRESDQLPVVARARELVREIGRDSAQQQVRAVLDLAEKAATSAGRSAELALYALRFTPGPQVNEVLQAQAQELRTLSTLLTHLVGYAQALPSLPARQLAELDGALAQIGSGIGSPPFQSRGEQSGGMSPSGAAVSEDVLRIAYAFAQEVGGSARQIALITQEMRASFVPFRLPSIMEEEDAAERFEPAYLPPNSPASPSNPNNPSSPSRWGWRA